MSGAADRLHPYALPDNDGHIIDVGVKFIVKAGERAIGSSSAVLVYETCRGEEPDDHTHPTEDEMFYVLAGEITFRCEGKTFDLSQGGFMFLPRGIKHGYTVRGDQPVKLLVITSPVRDAVAGGWGGFVGEMER